MIASTRKAWKVCAIDPRGPFHPSPGQIPLATCTAVEALRRQRYSGKQIASELTISPATVSRILRRLGLNKLSALEPAEPIRRYERDHPGDLIHIDIKKLVKFNAVGHRITGDRRGQGHDRGIGWEFVHVCIDDASRIAFVQVMPDDTKQSAVAFLNAAVAYYESLGVKVARVKRRLLQSLGLSRCLPRPRPASHPHQTIYASHQWKGRALHPNCPARMGLCQGLPQLRSSKS